MGMADVLTADVHVGVTSTSVDYTVKFKNVAGIDLDQTLKTWFALTPATMTNAIATFLNNNSVTGSVKVLALPVFTVVYVVDASDENVNTASSVFQLGNVVFFLVLFLALRPAAQ